MKNSKWTAGPRDIPCQRPGLRGGYLLAFASGATALIYEVLWLRQFVSLFGAMAPAVSATLSAIFLGLGAGSAVIGLRCFRFSRPLRAYGFLEIGIGAGALLVGPLVGLYEHAYPLLYAVFLGHHALFLGAKTILAVIALFLPSFLMGGTIVLLGQSFVSSLPQLGVVGSGLYFSNTLGAMLGALSVPFLLLPTLGMRWSYFGTALASCLIGAVACWMDARLHGRTLPEAQGFRVSEAMPVRPATRSESDPSLAREVSAQRRKPRIVHPTSETLPAGTVTAMAFFSGVFTLALEVLWTRMLAQIHENSIYSFAIVLAVFLAGLAGGSFLGRAVLVRQWDPRTTLGFAWIGAGLLVFASPGLFYSLTDGLSYVADLGRIPEMTTLKLAMTAMFLPTLLAGMILPLLLEITTRTHAGAAGSLIGRVLARNTVGGVVGPLLVTFVLLPGPGLWLSIAGIGLGMVVVGDVALQNLYPRSLAWTRRGVTLALTAAVAVVANPATLPRVRIGQDSHETLLYLSEGANGIVAVLEGPSSRRMLLDNFYTLGGTASALEGRQQAHIPLFLHPAPRSVAFAGLGTGITSGGALLPSVDKIVAIEMVPEVVDAAGKYFADSNLGVLKDPRVEVVNEDARVYLRSSGRKFDVIIGDLVVPWRSGESSLFTREHFEAARRALAPGGLYCQWLPMYQVSEEQFRIIAATFLDIFPETTLWRGDFLPTVPALALIGHTAPSRIDAEAVDARIRQLRPSSARNSPILSAPGGIWMFLVGPLRAADPEFVKARRNRESEPWIELLSPMTFLKTGKPTQQAFVGEALYSFMERIRTEGFGGSILGNLGSDPIRWSESGAIVWQASMWLHQGREEEANRRAAEGLALVPGQLQEVFNGRVAGE